MTTLAPMRGYTIEAARPIAPSESREANASTARRALGGAGIGSLAGALGAKALGVSPVYGGALGGALGLTHGALRVRETILGDMVTQERMAMRDALRESKKKKSSFEINAYVLRGMQDELWKIALEMKITSPADLAHAESVGLIPGPGDIARTRQAHVAALRVQGEGAIAQHRAQYGGGRSSAATVGPHPRPPVNPNAVTAAAKPGVVPKVPNIASKVPNIASKVPGPSGLERVTSGIRQLNAATPTILKRTVGIGGAALGAGALGYGAYRMLRNRPQPQVGV